MDERPHQDEAASPAPSVGPTTSSASNSIPPPDPSPPSPSSDSTSFDIGPDPSTSRKDPSSSPAPSAQGISTIFREVREYRETMKDRWEIIYNAVGIETKLIMKDKWFIIMTIITWLFGILPAMAYYLITVSTAGVSGDEVFDPTDFYNFYVSVFFFLVLHCGYISAKSITAQKANRSITLYLCRPISKLDYLLIKFLMVMLALTVLIILPNVLLFFLVIGILKMPFLWNLEHLWVLGSLLLYGLLIVSVFSLLSLAIGFVNKKLHWSIAGVFSFLFLTYGFSAAMRVILENDLPALLSPWDNLRQVGALLFGTDVPFDYPWQYSFVMLVSYVAVSLVILIYNINRVEVLE